MSQGVKRKRPESIAKSRKKSKDATKKRALVRRGPAIRGDQLKWKEVSINQHLDDAEGFYGLEEIDDVEIVRGEDGKGIFFKPAIGADTEVFNADSDDGDTNAEEWSGFEDESLHQSTNGLSNPDGISEKRPIDTQDLQDSLQADQDLSEDLSENVGFDVLEGNTDEADLDMSAWKDLEISTELLSALSTLKFTTPTLIQQAAIPPIISGKDVIGKAVTGSGKTLAFGIPIIQYWLNHNQQKKQKSTTPTAMILSPTRELAHQISKHLVDLCEGLDQRPRVTTVTGGLSILKQQRQLETADVIVATPGRLWEVIRESNDLLERLKIIRFLVVDEADRLLSEGHFQEVEEILDALDRVIIDENAEDEENKPAQHTRQTLVFSATFHKDLQHKLTSKKKFKQKDTKLLSEKQSMDYLMHKLPFQEEEKPTFVDANPDSQMAENLTETILECGEKQKDLYLYTYLLQQHRQRAIISPNAQNGATADSTSRILVFTNSVSAVKRLVPFLQSLDLPQTSISPLHSNMPQKSRLRSLERFSGQSTDAKQLSMCLLIATDVAARGLDIKGITTVVHYHVPRTADAYVHRSGRTARVQASGNSILLCSPDEAASVIKLIAKIHTGSQLKSAKDVVDRMYLLHDLLRQVEHRVDLAQKLVSSTQSTEKVKSEDNWLRNAANDLGVDYDSEEFEKADKQGRRGRGGGKERKQKQVAHEEDRTVRMAEWRAQLKDELRKRVDFGDGANRNMKYLAGGAFDVDKLLAERGQA